MEQLIKEKDIDTMSNEVNSKILEYEKNHKNGSGKYYAVDEMNSKLDKVISKYA